MLIGQHNVPFQEFNLGPETGCLGHCLVALFVCGIRPFSKEFILFAKLFNQSLVLTDQVTLASVLDIRESGLALHPP